MKIIYLSLALSLVIVSNSATAQFGGLLNQLKDQVTDAINSGSSSPKTPAPPQVNAPTPPKVNAPAPPTVNPSTTAIDTSSNKFQPNSDTAFSCRIAGKQLVFSKNFASEDPNISVNFNLVDVTKSAVDFRTTFKEPMMLSINDGNRQQITSYYFKIKQMTYAISHCEGMLCGNPNQPYWFTVFENNKKINQGDCDENTATDFKFPIEIDKKGNAVTQMKDVLIIKKSNLKFDPFN
jgi:hypothetical protein